MGALVGGIVAVIIGIAIMGLYGGSFLAWWSLFVKALAVGLPVMLLLGGIIAIAAGFSDLKDRAEERREKEKEAAQQPPAQK